jgi:acetyl-CoA synthetase
MPLYEQYLGKHRDDFATLTELQQEYKLNVPENFNYAYDVVDHLGLAEPEKRAMLWVSNEGEERTFTFADLARLSNKTANVLAGLGIGKGDFVMLTLKRSYQYWYTLLALHKIGAVAVPVTHLLTAGDFVYRFNAAGVKMIIATGTDNVTEHVDAALADSPTVELRAVTGGKVAAGWIDFDACVEEASDVWVRPEPYNKHDDMMLMIFSSGTTGYPKMVWHKYDYPLANIMTGCFWHRVVDDGLHFTISDTGWAKSLWGKIYGQWLGGSAVFTYDFDKFNASDILSKVEQYQVTTFCAPPTMYRYMIQEDITAYDLSKLTHCTTAGEALNPEVFNRWLEMTGLQIFEGFGQSESTVMCLTLYPWMQPKLGSMGLPAPGYRIALLDNEGEPCAAGTTGEICILTDEENGGAPLGLFGGYYRDSAKTSATWDAGVYHTGDTATIDELGFLWYVGRTDDVIKSSGYRIGPFEVESALMEHPAVVECAVTGVPDPLRGVIVKATVVLASGYEASDELTLELQNHVKAVTAPYKYPRAIEYVADLPKTISGKIRRVEIRKKDMEKFQDLIK